MIIKEKDSINASLAQLEAIIQLPTLPKDKLLQAEKELKILKSGNHGELDSAYFIDFYYKDSPNWAIIHDLRIEYNGLVAQIDHLLINRFLDFYILETKHYARGIKITEHGEFLISFQKTYVAVESPIEQNKRHVQVFKHLLKGEDILPKRLGFSIQPRFIPYVLVSPKSRIIRPKTKDFNTDTVIKSDEFYQKTLDNNNEEDILSTVSSMIKVVSRNTLKEIAEKIISYHRPAEIDYYKKLSISRAEFVEIANLSEDKKDTKDEKSEEEEKKKSYYCCSCQKAISRKVAMFCFGNKVRFGGKAYCFDCQKQFS